jgi:hypothetical protein
VLGSLTGRIVSKRRDGIAGCQDGEGDPAIAAERTSDEIPKDALTTLKVQHSVCLLIKNYA